MAKSHVSVADFPQCPMSIVTAFSALSVVVACHQALCRMSNLRNAHVALSMLGVKGHNAPIQAAQPAPALRRGLEEASEEGVMTNDSTAPSVGKTGCKHTFWVGYVYHSHPPLSRTLPYLALLLLLPSPPEDG